MSGFINAIKWEMILDIKESIRYKVGLFMDFLVFTSTFIIIYYLGIGEGFAGFYNVDERAGKMLVLIGYIIWQNASAALGYAAGAIRNESAEGIFEIRLQSRYPLTIVMFFRLLCTILIHLVTYIGILAFSAITTGFHINDIKILVISILISFPSLIGMYGIGLIFGGISVCEKSVGSLVTIVQTLLLLITNTISPTRNNIVFLLPFSIGIDITRKIYLHEMVDYKMIFMYFYVNLIWLVIGGIVFHKCMSYEKKYGSFDNY